MARALAMPRRHPESGIFFLRKRVPERFKAQVGKCEIKVSLHTRDAALARIRNLEVMLHIERQWAQFDGIALNQDGGVVAYAQIKGYGGPAAKPDAPIESLKPKRPQKAATLAERPRLRLVDLYKSYIKEAELAPSSVKRWTPVMGRLVSHLGHDDARAISRGDVIAWKDTLLREGIANITVRDVYVAAVKATLQFGLDQGELEANPAVGVKVRVRKRMQTREKGFTAEEATKILKATLRKPSGKISIEMAAARRWIPWICAYTGARVNEITPLTGRDFFERDGIPMMRIRAETNKTRKFRETPLHQDLLRQGLFKYAKARGARTLFYDPRRSRGGKDSNPHYKKVAERLAEWVRSLGIDDPRVQPNHGWRHRFSSIARSIAMPEDVRNVIQGHADRKVADRYGDTWPRVARRELDKIPRYRV
ncbi:hypothetical protein G8O24_26470 [Bradyrhizobium sp. INPA01-394B]|uniref:DUF6538 domain-containing protein n=1 Tax=Bradyrhizobium campsiandrae TaxID=1729892 RepID=A0ABR7U8I4_9BRAD|nr:DUF6538 domain-containing protein [Bradyrhizobium campsiandrae]MBC9880876.1 hypothetical protein [Bradyrhizobium campsiandrae]MBC9980290.1 hypothetical protein [Bradyrhizobium campsiandrae]